MIQCIQKPIQHWPSIVMIINDKATELSADKTVAIFDSRVSYYCPA